MLLGTAGYSAAGQSLVQRSNLHKGDSMDEFRDGVTRVGQKALGIMEDYLDGKRDGTDKVKEASRMIGAAIKIEHMNQIRVHTEKSLAIRLAQFLPKDGNARQQYIATMNPEIKPLLLARPEKRKEIAK